MKSSHSLVQINKQINILTEAIRCNNPDLYDKLCEMTITIPKESHPCIDIDVLTDYFFSLQGILKNYQKASKVISIDYLSSGKLE